MLKSVDAVHVAVHGPLTKACGPRTRMLTAEVHGPEVGTPAITTRGFADEETRQLTNWICDVLQGLESDNSEAVIDAVRDSVKGLCARFPVYAD